MNKPVMLCATFMVILSAGAPGSQSARDDAVPAATGKTAAHIDGICGSLFQGQHPISPTPGACPSEADLVAIVAAWVSATLDLPEIRVLPAVRYASPQELGAIRRAASGGSQAEVSVEGADHANDIVALYHDVTRTIYLQQEWTGETPAEISVLVHEMVHHAQNLGGLEYECPAAREKLAFAVQAQWLSLFGQSLESEFSIDPMTLLVRTSCP